jgi:hypothetical protein
MVPGVDTASNRSELQGWELRSSWLQRTEPDTMQITMDVSSA